MLAFQKEVPLLDIIAELGIVPGVTLDKVVWSPNFGLFEYVAGFDKGCWSHTVTKLDNNHHFHNCDNNHHNHNHDNHRHIRVGSS